MDSLADVRSSGVGPPEPVELLALDIDGTLLDRKGRLPSRNAEAIRSAMERRVLVVLASARPPRALLGIYKQLQLRTAVISYNGAMVYDPPSRQLLLHRPIEADLARSIIEAARSVHPETLVHVERLNRWLTDRHDPAYNTETGKLFPPDVVAPLETWLTEPVTKLMLLGEPARLDEVRRHIEHRYARQIGGSGSDRPIRLLQTDRHLLQLQNPLSSKALAVALVASFYGVRRERVMAVGDALNDYGMLRWSGFGVAMGNAMPELLGVADAVTGSNDQAGLAEAIERWVLGSAG